MGRNLQQTVPVVQAAESEDQDSQSHLFSCSATAESGDEGRLRPATAFFRRARRFWNQILIFEASEDMENARLRTWKQRGNCSDLIAAITINFSA